MRLFHKESGRIHTLVIRIGISFAATDFMLSTKAITPIQVQYDSKSTSGKCEFYCPECEKEIPIDQIISKCFKCGELFTVENLMGHKQSGLVFCKEDSEKTKEEKDAPKSFATFLENYVIK